MNNLLKGLLIFGVGAATLKAVKNRGGANIAKTKFEALSQNEKMDLASILIASWASRNTGAVVANAASPLVINPSMAPFNKYKDVFENGEPAIFGEQVSITGTQLANIMGITLNLLKSLIFRVRNGESIQDDLEIIYTPDIRDQRLLAQYNQLYGETPEQAKAVGTTSSSFGFDLGSSVDTAEQAKPVGTTSSSFGFDLGSSVDTPEQAKAVGTTSSSFGFDLGSSVDTAEQAKTVGTTSSSFGFSTIPSFQEFKSNPRKYRKK